MPLLPQFFLNGSPVDALPPDSIYSDGLLETMRCQGGRLPLWPLHQQRLLRSGRVSEANLERIGDVLRLVGAQCPEEAARARLRWGLVEGVAQWDLSLLPLGNTPELVRGVRLFPCSTELLPWATGIAGSLARETANPGCKRLERTRYNRAKSELPAGEDCDGLLLDDGGRVIESLRCNLLVFTGGIWLTPDLSRCGVRGVMRDWLAGQATLREADLTLDALCSADEVALCNSVRGVLPVRELIGRRAWSVDEEGSIPATRRLQQLVTELLW